MRVNLRVFEDELGLPVASSHYKTEPWERTCAHLTFFQPGMPWRDDLAVIARASLLPDTPPSVKGLLLIAIGEPAIQWKEAARELLVLNEDVDPVAALEQGWDILDRYRQWESSLQRSLDEGEPLRRLGELSYPLFDNPLYLPSADFSTIFQVVGNMKRLHPDAYARYQEHTGQPIPLAEGSTMSLEAVDAITADPEFIEAAAKDHPTIYSGQVTSFRDLFVNIRVNGQWAARLMVEEVCHPLRPKDFLLVDILAKYVARGLKARSAELFGKSRDTHGIMAKLLAHRFLERRAILRLLEQFGWDEHDEYLCMVLESQSYDKRPEVLSAQALRLARVFPHSCYVIHEEQLVFALNSSRTSLSRDKLLAQVQPLLRDSLLEGGISAPFNDFKNLYYFYLQARDSLHLGRKGNPSLWFYRAEDYLLEAMLQRAHGSQRWEALCPQGLIRLVEYDRQNATTLVATLKAFLECDRSVTATARHTYSSRSTCIYRLKRIDEISGLNLNDPDTRLALVLALKAIESQNPESLGKERE